MKKIITSILVAIIVGMATYIIFDIYQIPEHDNELITQTTIDKEKQSDNLFVKKKECAGYKEKIMEDIMIPTLIYNDSGPELIQIFYSPKRNSCLYVFDYYKSPDCLKMDTDAYLEIGCQFKESQIVDFLTKEIVYSSMTYDNCLDRLLDKENTDVSACKTVLEKVEEFKS